MIYLYHFFPRNFNTLEERTFEEWSSILDLSTRWGFTSIRDLAIRCLKPPSPLRRLILARKCAVEEWVNPALLELCERPEPLGLDEARLMDFEDVVLVGSVRQNVRSPTLTTNSAGIKDCIQAWKSGEPWSPDPAAVSRPSTPPVWSRPPTPRGRPSAANNPGFPLSDYESPPRSPEGSFPRSLRTAAPVPSVGRPSGFTPGASGGFFGTPRPLSSDSMGRGTPSVVVPSSPGEGTDEWAIPVKQKKKKSGR